MAYTKKTKEQKLKQSMEKLMENVEKMSKEDYKKYLKAITAGRPHNYSFMNWAMIVSQFYAKTGEFPTVVGGATTFWKEVDRRVVKEQYAKHGLWILIPIFKKFPVEEISPTGEKTKKIAKMLVNFRYGKVYDISQTEGKEYIEPDPVDRVTKDTMDVSIENLIAFLNNKKRLGLSIERKPCSDILTGGYVQEVPATKTGYIRLNSERSESDNKSTLLHELSHWFMDHTKDHCNLSCRQKEVDAETAAYCLGQEFGIEAESTEYVFGWSKGGEIRPNFEAIVKAFNKINRLMVDFMEAKAAKEVAKEVA